MKRTNKYLTIILLLTSHAFGKDIFLKDAANFYSKETGIVLLEAVIPALIMAHTPIDTAINDFYQNNFRTEKTNTVAQIVKLNGYNKFLVATYLSSLALGYFFESSKVGDYLYDFGANSIRACCVGLPPLIIGQNVIGASRPEDLKSHWAPFSNDHSLSGHAFMGAIPWITLAKMTDNLFFKSIFYIGSTGVSLSRYNDAAHYPSQIMLAWVLAYVSCEAVSRTNLSLSPTLDGLSLTATF